MKRRLRLFCIGALVVFNFFSISLAEPSAWAIQEVNKATLLNLSTEKTSINYQDRITREEFCELVINLHDALADKPAASPSINRFVDTTNPEVLKANALGIVNGVSDTLFDPNASISREAIATMLNRLFTVLNLDILLKSDTQFFEDENEISTWGKNPIQILNKLGILGGVGNNRISPKGNATKEQSLALVVRTYEKFSDKSDWVNNLIEELGLSSHREITVDGGDSKGYRNELVKVDVGFSYRTYWAFTNEHEQLTTILADKIILQDDLNEPVTYNGRYYEDEAKIIGVESVDLVEGHVIADSLGGVANAYNITPQNATLNQLGEQANMEKKIREAGGCSHFIATMEYENTVTQTPSAYAFTYLLNGIEIKHSFKNESPISVNQPINTTPIPIGNPQSSNSIVIVSLHKEAEYVEIKNTSTTAIDISGWTMVSEKGNQTFKFPTGTIIASNQIIRLTSGALAGTGDFTMAQTTIWNNSSNDPAVLLDDSGFEVSRLEK